MTAQEFLKQLQMDYKMLDSVKHNLEHWRSVQRLVEGDVVTMRLVAELSQKANAIAARQALFERLLDKIECPTERACLMCRYTFGDTIRTIGGKLYYTERQIHNYLNRGIQHFEELYNAVFTE